MKKEKGSIVKLNSTIIMSASVVGKKEHEGPLGDCFDVYDEKDRFGEKKWDRSESVMQKMALGRAMEKAELKDSDLDVIFAGDLQNQCTGAAYGLIDYDIPFIGLYGACSTSAESILLASMMTSYRIFNRCAAVTSSHNCAAEIQYRTPLEYGGQRPPTAQWTVTGAGAFIIENADNIALDENNSGKNTYIVDGLVGKVIEMGVTDANNMGAAMAPAAADTIKRYFDISGKKTDDFDLILTGDLGIEGSGLLYDLMNASGMDIKQKHNDCGIMIYKSEEQDTHSGGSGCGCSAVVLASYILPKMKNGEINNILFIATGAMMSPSSIKQGEAIPAIAHLVHITTSSEKQNLII